MALAITGVIKGTSKRKLYEELGLESLKDRTWLRHLCYLHKIASTKMRPYLYEILPPPPPPPQRSQKTQVPSNLQDVVMNPFKILSYHLLLVKGTNWILKLQISTLGLLKIVSMTFMIDLVSNFFTDYD